jgi:capsular exopolysaccharide synthesis family protein
MAAAPAPEAPIDLRTYVRVLRRRIRPIAGVALLVFGLAIGYSYLQTPLYTATTQVLVQPPATNDFQASTRPETLVSMETERRIVGSAPVAKLARARIGSSESIRDLLAHVSVDVAPDSLILDISYTDTAATEVASGADAFAAAYLEYKRELALGSLVETRELLQGQIEDLQERAHEQIRIMADSEINSARWLTARAARNALQGQISILTEQLTSLPPDVDPGQVILPAEAPLSPSSPNHVVNGGVGLFLGLILGLLVAFALDRLDERLKGREDLEEAIQAPVVGMVPHFDLWSKHERAVLVSIREPTGPTAEAYRTLRTSVSAMARQADVRTLLITSALPGEGKSTTAANLSAALATAGERVLLVSADLRKPRVHEFFELPNWMGVADVLHGRSEVGRAIQPSGIPGLSVMTSGAPSPDGSELLHSPNLPELLGGLRSSFDLIVVDSTPVLGLADALAVAQAVDGVLIVATPRMASRGAVAQAREQLVQVGGRVLCGVLNAVTQPKASAYGYGYVQQAAEEAAAAERVGSNGSRRRAARRRSAEGARQRRRPVADPQVPSRGAARPSDPGSRYPPR